MVKTDEEGRPEETITMKTSATVNVTTGAPNGTESLAQGDYVSWSKNAYNSAGQLVTSQRYHDIPSSGDGTRYTNYYETNREYDDMGRLEWNIQDVKTGTPYELRGGQADRLRRDGAGSRVQDGNEFRDA